ncbi:TetR/AcrR family transcriptional regulator [Caulobacter sp. BK020]|uniref:TetR/AcrR family transcriptional regulator n=1 Tax=Caulobacter sp. BK020 TaxID=2512117 RepID=UPI0010EC1324|nr:TetR/AcrR family transcriptional regulator [Caulobacter sp. BK020]TCS11897.1 TetR family transcriptional regulator [Caulobacter sp. BK020]
MTKRLDLVTQPDLEAKSRPSRRNGINTFEMILATTGELLAEVGFERLNTNLVCERAGLSPPALYRYFPNKYALLSELARRLMDAQDDEVFAWLQEEGANWTPETAVESSIHLQRRVTAVTRRQPGGVWILRAIRAIPVLQEVRAASSQRVLEKVFGMLRKNLPHVSDERLRVALRLTEQMQYAAIEMLVEDPTLDEELIFEEVAWMISRYYRDLAKRTAPTPA